MQVKDPVRSGDLYMTIVQVDSRSMRLCKCSYRSIQDFNTLSTNIYSTFMSFILKTIFIRLFNLRTRILYYMPIYVFSKSIPKNLYLNKHLMALMFQNIMG